MTDPIRLQQPRPAPKERPDPPWRRAARAAAEERADREKRGTFVPCKFTVADVAAVGALTGDAPETAEPEVIEMSSLRSLGVRETREGNRNPRRHLWLKDSAGNGYQVIATDVHPIERSNLRPPDEVALHDLRRVEGATSEVGGYRVASLPTLTDVYHRARRWAPGTWSTLEPGASALTASFLARSRTGRPRSAPGLDCLWGGSIICPTTGGDETRDRA